MASVFMQLFRTHCAHSDLGPVSVNWFEELTAEATQRQARIPDVEEKRAEAQDDHLLQTPKHKPNIYSQLDFTPTIFKESSLCSPLFLSPTRDLHKNPSVSENAGDLQPDRCPTDSPQLHPSMSHQYPDDSPAMKNVFKTPFWDTKSTHRTPQQDRKNDINDSLFCTPKLIRNPTPSRYIMESLGAEADPEISWSSSMATPPSPTVIIAHANEASSRIRSYDSKDAVIVQSLFSKLCDDKEESSRPDGKILGNLNVTEVRHAADSSAIAPDVNIKPASNSQKVRKEDHASNAAKKEACQTSENVLEGMEDVLSIFFTNNKPSLRKVKADCRAKRRTEMGNGEVWGMACAQNAVIPSEEGYPKTCHNFESINHFTHKQDTSTVPSSYEWSPLTLPDSTPRDTYFPYTNHERDCKEKEIAGDSDKSSLSQAPSGTYNVIAASEKDLPETIQENKSNSGGHEEFTHSTPEKTSRHNASSADQPLFNRMDENRTKSSQQKEKSFLSALKRQTKFLYCLNEVKNGQDDRSAKCSSRSNGQSFRLPDVEDGEKQKVLDTMNARTTATKEDKDCSENNSLDFQVKEHMDPINRQTDVSNITNYSQTSMPNLLATINPGSGIKRKVSTKAGGPSKRRSTLDSRNSLLNECTVKQSHNEFADRENLETGLCQNIITGDPEKQSESHKISMAKGTELATSIITVGVIGQNVGTSNTTELENYEGFKTASNKKIHISEENLRKAEFLLKDDDSLHHNTDLNKPLHIGTDPALKPVNKVTELDDNNLVARFGGFRTGLQKEIQLPANKVNQAMLLFKDIQEDLNPNLSDSKMTNTHEGGKVKAETNATSLDAMSRKSLQKNEESQDTLSAKQSHIKVLCGQKFSSRMNVGSDEAAHKKELHLPTEDQSYACQSLTESQNAEVHELSSILENAYSQFGFTQFGKTKVVTLNIEAPQISKDEAVESQNLNNSDVWQDVDFNDSFAAGVKHDDNEEPTKSPSEWENITTACDARNILKMANPLLTGNKDKFGGFSLASGRAVNISDEDMIKAMEIFGDIADATLSKQSLTDDNKRTLPTNFSSISEARNAEQAPKDGKADLSKDLAKMVCPQTENRSREFEGKGDYILHKPQCKTSLMDELICDNDARHLSETDCVQNVNPTSSIGFSAPQWCQVPASPMVGFATAKGKVIDVDKTSLAKARAMFTDLLDSNKLTENESETFMESDQRIPGIIGFPDERKETHEPTVKKVYSIKVTRESHTKCLNSCQEYEKELGHDKNVSKHQGFVTKVAQFSTAGGKPLHISDESLKKAQEIFADVDNHQLEPTGTTCKALDGEKTIRNTPDLQDVKCQSKQNREPVFKLPSLDFRTARVKSIHVSDDSLQKSRMMLDTDNGDQINPSETQILTVQNDAGDFSQGMTSHESTSVLPTVGFSTASGKIVSVSHESLQKAKMMFAETDSIDIKCGLETNSKDHINGCKTNEDSVALDSFKNAGPNENESTADQIKSSGVATSDKTALEKSSKVETKTEPWPLEASSNSTKACFITAAGKPVHVTDDALKNAKHVFAELDRHSNSANSSPQDAKLPIVATKSTRALPPQGFSTTSSDMAAGYISDPQNMGCPEILEQSRIETRDDQNVETNTLQSNVKKDSSPLNTFEHGNGTSVSVDGNITGNISRIQVHNNTVPQMGSFKTARGKPVTLSEKAFEKAKQMFAEIDGQTEDEHGLCLYNVKVNSKSMALHNKSLPDVLTPFISGKESIHNLPSAGLRTARGERVPVSNSALQKARLLFAEKDDSHIEDKPCNKTKERAKSFSIPRLPVGDLPAFPGKNTAPRLPPLGFSTAGGKTLEVSDKALQKARQVFAETDELEDNQRACMVNVKDDSMQNAFYNRSVSDVPSPTGKESTCKPPALGFRTAQGESVPVSGRALQKARLLFTELEGSHDEDKCKENVENTSLNTFSTPNLPHDHNARLPPLGFSTAGGKAVVVSDSALQKARQLFAETDDTLEDNQRARMVNVKDAMLNAFHNRSLSDVPSLKGKESTCKPSGFRTARGERVQVSERALQKAKLLFTELEGSHDEHKLTVNVENTTLNTFSTPNLPHDHNTRLPPLGFSTAGGKTVVVSESALQKDRQLFAEADDAHLDDNQRARMVNVKDDAVLNAFHNRSLSDVPSPTGNGSTCKPSALGFRTARGESVPVSDGALQKARLLFTEIEGSHDEDKLKENVENTTLNTFSTPNLPYDHNTRLPPLGFSTAGGKTVVVSDSTLQKARQLFDETDDAHLEDKQKKSIENVEENGRPNAFGKIVIGKTITMSDCALQKTKLESPDIEEIHYPKTTNICNKINTTGHLIPNASTMPSFRTAGGKSVTLSEDSLKRAQEMFAEIDDPSNDQQWMSKPKVEENVKSGALNTSLPPSMSVKESDNNLPPPVLSTVKGRLLFENTDEKQNLENEGRMEIERLEEEAMDTRNLQLIKEKNTNTSLKHITEVAESVSGSHVKSNISTLVMPSFSTAGGKSVTIAEESLKKAKEMFSEMDNNYMQEKLEDILNYPNVSIPKVNSSGNKPFGFSTASGKKVSVSETALEKARGLLNEFTDDESLSIKPLQGNHLHHNDVSDDVSKTVDVPSPEPIAGTNQKHGTSHTDIHTSVEINHLFVPCSSDVPCQKRRHSTPYNDAGIPNKMKAGSITTSSHTPENYFEIEAAESAKAFMDDEDLIDVKERTEDTASKALPLRHGKRLRSEDKAPQGEPTIKRQLLLEFDRSLEHKSQQNFQPLTSSPHSHFKDRRKFQHNVSLRPSSCKPPSLSSTPNHLHSLQPPLPSKLGVLKPTSIPFISPFKKVQVDKEVNQTDPVFDIEEAFEDVKCLEDDVPKSENMKSSDFSELVPSLRCARDMQEMRLRKKQRQRIRPQPGLLYRQKTSSADRIPLLVAVQGRRPTVYTTKQLYRFGVLRSHLGVTSETAKTFEFQCLDYISKESFLSGGGVQIADGGWLVPSDRLTAGREEFYRALCDTSGVDPKLISPEWAYNHYRWIVWKLAAMGVKFPDLFASRSLTPERVLLQLKYRYDVEIDKSQRSALRKIMERDDSATKTLVLCVSQIISCGGSEKSESGDTKQVPPVIEVTDGWYCIKALLDAALTALLSRRRLFVGQKIIVHGAELVGSEEACTPLEAPDSLMLKLSANSTRPARWDTKLGYFRDPRPFSLPLSSLFAEGGIVGCVDVVIQRIYPMQWMEKMANGTYTFRNDRAEEREAERHSARQQKSLETLFLKIQEEFNRQEAREKKGKRTKHHFLSVAQISALQDGAEIYEALQNESDPGYLESCLSNDQLRALNQHRQVVNDKKQAEIQAEFRKAMESADQGSGGCARREVTPVWKLRIVDYKEQEPHSAYLLNIWRPLPDVVSLLKEGCRYKMYQLAASQSKSKADTASVQLTATKKTQFQQLQPSQDALQTIYTERRVTELNQLSEAYFTPEYGEVDIVGLVITIQQKLGAAPTVYLSDASHHIVAVKFWVDLSQLCLEELTKPCALLAISNLRWRSEYAAGIPIVSAGDLAYVSTNPKETHLQRALHKLRQSVQSIQKLHQEAEAKLHNTLMAHHPEERRSLSLHRSDPSASPSLGNKFATPAAKTGRTSTMDPLITPDKSIGPSSLSSEMDPKTCKKMKGLDFLSRIPSPSTLTPMRPLVSPSLQRAFRPPRSMQKDASRGEELPVLKSRGEFVADEELAMINTQALDLGAGEGKLNVCPESTEESALQPPEGVPTGSATTTKQSAPSTYQGRLRKRR